MNLLLDTHIIVCTVTYSSELPRHARTLLENPENTIYYSIASIWEIVVKHAAHSEDFPYTGSQLAEACQKADFLLLEGKLDHILTIDTLEYPKDAPRHKDPFDKLLLAQAKSENMFFVTHDKKFLIIMSPASYLFKTRRQRLLLLSVTSSGSYYGSSLRSNTRNSPLSPSPGRPGSLSGPAIPHRGQTPS